MEKEQFRLLATDLQPVFEEIVDVLKKHKVEELSSLVISADGYFNFTPHHTGWEMKRVNSNDKINITLTRTEEL